MSVITLLGTSVATLSSANNIGLATTVRITNLKNAELTLTVATVGTPSLDDTFPGTVVIESGHTILLRKGPTDTIAGGSDGELVATAVSVGG
tara:strand:+ start:1021 stop:1296 length:276 start_codon:yes stop_codon:yes gene_type:complete